MFKQEQKSDLLNMLTCRPLKLVCQEWKPLFHQIHKQKEKLVMMILNVFFFLFCYRAFKLDEDNALLTYVRLQLLPPTPPSSCTSPLSLTQDCIEDLPYQRNVRKVVHKISDTTALLNLLVEVCAKVTDFVLFNDNKRCSKCARNLVLFYILSDKLKLMFGDCQF